MNKPMPTVLTMKRVLDLHLRPSGLDLAMFTLIYISSDWLISRREFYLWRGNLFTFLARIIFAAG